MNNKRIEEIAKLINNANLVVDVGSDHAQLSILLISQQKAKKVINIEKNLKPYQNSVNNTKEYQDKIENILSDGFDKFDKSIDIDYLTIAGVGAKTMLDIVLKSSNKIENIIFCTNNNEHLLREFAYNNFYKIKKDLTIIDNDFFYTLLWLSKHEGLKPKGSKKFFYLGHKQNKKDDYFYRSFLESKINSLSKIEDLKSKNKIKYKQLKWFTKAKMKW